MYSLNNSISLREAQNLSDVLGYLSVIIHECLFMWIWYVLIMKLGDWKNFQLFIIQYESKIIGGLCLTDFPIAKYKPYNWFNAKARAKVEELRDAGYRGGGCFVVKSELRNKGIGTAIFHSAFSNQKVYFTSSSKARNLYLRNGAKVVYKSTYDIFTFDGSGTIDPTDSLSL